MLDRDDAINSSRSNQIKIEIQTNGPVSPKLELKINSNERGGLGGAFGWIGRFIPFAFWGGPSQEK